MPYPHNDIIKDAMRGKSELVQRDGLNYLIPSWARNVASADSEDNMDEWLNDLDGRKIIDEILELLTEQEKAIMRRELEPIDQLFARKTFETNECVWGETNERSNGYNRIKNWYYYRLNQPLYELHSGEFSYRVIN
jgi:hypothetical protein